MNNSTQKVKLLVLYDILYRLTDEEHYLNTDEIIKLLADKGIAVSRKILREDIKTLNDYGFDVMEEKKKYYYYYIANRSFESAEISMLMDVVTASKLDAAQKEQLLSKLANTLGIHRARMLLNHVITLDKPKHTNSHIIYSIDSLETAIDKKKKVSFRYFLLDYEGKKVYRKEGKRYVVNPLVMIWDRDNYYLVCYDDKHSDTMNYRVDRMESVEIEEDDRLERSDLSNFNAEEYKLQMFSMFGGEVQKVEIQFSAGMIDDIYDKFGEGIYIKKHDENDYRAVVPIQVSKVFYSWVVGSQGKVHILSPHKVKEEFNEFVKKVKEEY